VYKGTVVKARFQSVAVEATEEAGRPRVTLPHAHHAALGLADEDHPDGMAALNRSIGRLHPVLSVCLPPVAPHHADELSRCLRSKFDTHSSTTTTRSPYRLTTSERARGLANRILFSRYYIIFYLVMTGLSLATVILSLKEGELSLWGIFSEIDEPLKGAGMV
jgi:hypothetical protein